MANNNQIYKMSNAGGFKSLNRYYDMLAGNAVWNPWEPQGAYDALASVTVPSGGVASVTFAGIPTGYKHLQVRGFSQNARATYPIDDISLTFNSDTGNNYTSHALYGDGASAGVFASAPRANIYSSGLEATNAGSGWAASVIDILDYASIVKNKTVRWLGGWDTNGTIAGYGGRIGLVSGSWMNSSTAISSITLTPANGNFNQYSQFALYGVK